jgi:HAD superfamily hydrolase (TIGR01549 family)
MKFYRALRPVAALTFDLDDTLYDNRPVIRRTEQQTVAFMRQYHDSLSDIDSLELAGIRTALLSEEPEIYHDVTQWRTRALICAMQRRGMSQAQATQGAEAVMENFLYWRSQIVVPDETHTTLDKLATRWPLVAITNGNADPARCGLGHYFQFVLRAGPDGRAKPFADMYRLAAQHLALMPEQILHVGDDLTTDIAGAVSSGLQACWINSHDDSLMQLKDSRLLPHMEICRLAELATLL